MRIISVIPARFGSKGLEKKNIKILHGKPLIAHSIIQSLNSKKINETYVSSENIEIQKIAQQNGAIIIPRPKELSTDKASTDDVLVHAAEYLHWDFDYMVLLQVTSPLRFSHQIDAAIQKIIDTGGDSLLSVSINYRFLWSPEKKLINFEKRLRRQELPIQYQENGSIYITKKELLQKTGNRLGDQIIFYLMTNFQSFEVDDYFDFRLVEWVMEYYDFS